MLFTIKADTPLEHEILEEELHLAKEGNVNHVSLGLSDTRYADGENIIKKSQAYNAYIQLIREPYAHT